MSICLKPKNRFFIFAVKSSPDQILIGNLQIEKYKKENWEKEPAALIFNKNNLQKTMVVAALRQALRSKKKQILFQRGTSMEIAQWWNESYYYHTHTLVTKENYSDFKALYEKALRKWENYQTGMIENDPHPQPHKSKFLIYKKSREKIYKVPLEGSYLLSLVYVLANQYPYREIPAMEITRDRAPGPAWFSGDPGPRVKPHKALSKALEKESYITDLNTAVLYHLHEVSDRLAASEAQICSHIALYHKLKFYFKENDAEQTLDHLDKIFNYWGVR